jgi:hypothetical protein
MKTYKRGEYKQILRHCLSQRQNKIVENLVKKAAKADHLDEHGWKFTAEFDNAGRGHALNWDLYGIAKDVHSGRWLVVIQVRQYVKRTRNGYSSTRKSYYLIGHNEDNTVFAHCVSDRKVRAAINAGRCPVYAAQSWIFDHPYTDVVRQGDIGFVPVKRFQGEPMETGSIVLENSHAVVANEFRQKAGVIYVKKFTCEHLPGTHPQVAGEGVYKIFVGRRARHYSFATPTID